MDNLFFDNWNVLLRTLIVAVLGYASLLLFLRVSGKRTLSKMNAFDFVVTIALGSTLASLLLHQGRMLPGALRRTRVTESEVHAALRSAGLGGVEEARAVVLETDGTFSVIGRNGRGDSALEGLETPDRR